MPATARRVSMPPVQSAEPRSRASSAGRPLAGKIHYLWRAIDVEDEVLDIIAQPRRDRKATLKLMRQLLKRQGYLPDAIVTDRLRSYGAPLRD